MSEEKIDSIGPYGPPERRNLGGSGFSGEKAPLARIRRRGRNPSGPPMTGLGLLDHALGQNDIGNVLSGENHATDIVTTPQIVVVRAIKESRRRIHPYNIPKGTKTWSGPYGKDGTMQLDDIPVDITAYPVYKKAYSGAVTVMMEVESPPELKGQRFRVAKLIKETGWIR